ncbi:MAG TPA: hypothetical protein VKD90_28810 [Gemmataceae bacterium]|nr:hypothetical protein [Gemmataceae bacterium]
MSTAISTRPRRSVAVNFLGVVTLLLGLGYTFLGGVFLYSGSNMARDIADDNDQGWGPLLALVAGFVLVVGVALVVPGVLGLVAGLLTVLRKPVGPILTYIFAGFAILWGLAFLAVNREGANLIAPGVAQILYGILAFVILIRSGVRGQESGVRSQGTGVNGDSTALTDC